MINIRSIVKCAGSHPVGDSIAEAFPWVLSSNVLMTECKREKLPWETFVEWLKKTGNWKVSFDIDKFYSLTKNKKDALLAGYSVTYIATGKIYIRFELMLNKNMIPSEWLWDKTIIDRNMNRRQMSPTSKEADMFWNALERFPEEKGKLDSCLSHELTHAISMMSNIAKKGLSYVSDIESRRNDESHIKNLPYGWITDEYNSVLNEIRKMIRDGFADDEMVNSMMTRGIVNTTEQAMDLIELAMYRENSVREFRRIR
jgi:hypothetical protein